MAYQGIEVLGGKVMLPYVALATYPGGIPPENVAIEFIRPFRLQKPLEAYRSANAEKMAEAAKSRGQVFFDGKMARLAQFFDYEDDGTLELVLQCSVA